MTLMREMTLEMARERIWLFSLLIWARESPYIIAKEIPSRMSVAK